MTKTPTELTIEQDGISRKLIFSGDMPGPISSGGLFSDAQTFDIKILKNGLDTGTLKELFIPAHSKIEHAIHIIAMLLNISPYMIYTDFSEDQQTSSILQKYVNQMVIGSSPMPFKTLKDFSLFNAKEFNEKYAFHIHNARLMSHSNRLEIGLPVQRRVTYFANLGHDINLYELFNAFHPDGSNGIYYMAVYMVEKRQQLIKLRKGLSQGLLRSIPKDNYSFYTGFAAGSDVTSLEVTQAGMIGLTLNVKNFPTQESQDEWIKKNYFKFLTDFHMDEFAYIPEDLNWPGACRDMSFTFHVPNLKSVSGKISEVVMNLMTGDVANIKISTNSSFTFKGYTVLSPVIQAYLAATARYIEEDEAALVIESFARFARNKIHIVLNTESDEIIMDMYNVSSEEEKDININILTGLISLVIAESDGTDTEIVEFKAPKTLAEVKEKYQRIQDKTQLYLLINEDPELFGKRTGPSGSKTYASLCQVIQHRPHVISEDEYNIVIASDEPYRALCIKNQTYDDRQLYLFAAYDKYPYINLHFISHDQLCLPRCTTTLAKPAQFLTCAESLGAIIPETDYKMTHYIKQYADFLLPGRRSKLPGELMMLFPDYYVYNIFDAPIEESGVIQDHFGGIGLFIIGREGNGYRVYTPNPNPEVQHLLCLIIGGMVCPVVCDSKTDNGILPLIFDDYIEAFMHQNQAELRGDGSLLNLLEHAVPGFNLNDKKYAGMTIKSILRSLDTSKVTFVVDSISNVLEGLVVGNVFWHHTGVSWADSHIASKTITLDEALKNFALPDPLPISSLYYVNYKTGYVCAQNAFGSVLYVKQGKLKATDLPDSADYINVDYESIIHTRLAERHLKPVPPKTIRDDKSKALQALVAKFIWEGREPDYAKTTKLVYFGNNVSIKKSTITRSDFLETKARLEERFGLIRRIFHSNLRMFLMLGDLGSYYNLDGESSDAKYQIHTRQISWFV